MEISTDKIAQDAVNRIAEKIKNLKTLNIVSENTKRYMQLEEKIYSEKRKTNNSFK